MADASPYFIGDSIADGLKTAARGQGDTMVGRSPAQVLQAIQNAPSLSGRKIVLSTGLSNNPDDMASVAQQFQALKAKGVNPSDISVVGLGSRFNNLNQPLGSLVSQQGANFSGGFQAGADGVHPASYGSTLHSVFSPSPQGAQSGGPTVGAGQANYLPRLMQNIAGIESSGWSNPYAARGSGHEEREIAVTANIRSWGPTSHCMDARGSWSVDASPQQFAANPDAQEKVAQAKLGQYAALYGPSGAANKWFTGNPNPNPNITDATATSRGTSAGNYAARAIAGIDAPNAPPPAPGAQARPFTPTPVQAPGPMDPSAQAGGPGAPLGTPGSTVNPPIPTTPGTTINSTPAVAGVTSGRQWSAEPATEPAKYGEGAQASPTIASRSRPTLKPSPMIGPQPQVRATSRRSWAIPNSMPSGWPRSISR